MTVVTLLGALGASPAMATPTDAQVQAAREIFAQAEKDEDASRWSDALEKLRRVSEVRLTAGVRYHVALCEENLGQLAGALSDYTAADTQARSENAQDVQRLVGTRLASLGPRVPRLTVHVVPEVPDEVVTLDGQPIAHSLIGAALPVDPGAHRVEATAANRPTSSALVTLRERDSTVLEVKLGALSTPTPTPTSTLTPHRAAATLATAATVVLAAGGVGAFLLAGGSHDSAVSSCARVVSASADACDSQKNEVRAWDFVAAGAWVGAALAATIAIVLWTKPSHEPTATTTRILAGPGSLVLGGRF